MQSTEDSRWQRHWPLLLTGVAWLFVGLFPSQIVRAILAVASIVLMLYQWLKYRRTTHGYGFAFSSVIVAGFFLASVWLALNVSRVYTYSPEEERTWALHESIVAIQVALVWAIGVFLMAALVLALLWLAQWLARQLAPRLRLVVLALAVCAPVCLVCAV